ncbi:MAG: hypothetical protein JRE23_02830 [Deltaproteobacteria bacterium]|nr:hypothetical protein [Deltaproteobacteria bacterium]
MRFYGLWNEELMSDNGIILWGPLGVAKAYYETLKEEQKQSFKIMEFEEEEICLTF